MTPVKKHSRIPDFKRTLATGTMAIMIAGSAIFTGCSSGETYEMETKTELTQGLITSVKEVRQDEFKITDETVVPLKSDSRLIAEYMDGQRDTFTLDEARLMEKHESTRSRGMSGAFMYGVMGYYMGRSLSSPINQGAYASQSAYQKSSTKAASTVKSTAKRTTVRKPTNSSKGFGSGKSTRSYGG